MGSGPKNRNNPGESRNGRLCGHSEVKLLGDGEADTQGPHPSLFMPRGSRSPSVAAPLRPFEAQFAFGVLFPCILSFGTFVGVFRLRSPGEAAHPRTAFRQAALGGAVWPLPEVSWTQRQGGIARRLGIAGRWAPLPALALAAIIRVGHQWKRLSVGSRSDTSDI